MATPNYIKKASDLELAVWRANAEETGSSCGGHGKASYNHEVVRHCEAELAERGISKHVMSIIKTMKGVFNGDGAQ